MHPRSQSFLGSLAYIQTLTALEIISERLPLHSGGNFAGWRSNEPTAG